jgi:hypothetical protein
VAAGDITSVTQNEILYSLNKPEDILLAIVEFLSDGAHQAPYVRRPFEARGVATHCNGATVNFPMTDLIALTDAPRQSS